MTATATIQVKYVNPPKEGKNKGSIRVEPMDPPQYYEVPPIMLALFREGATYDIEFSEREWKGKTYRTVSKARPQERPSVVNSAGSVSAPVVDGSQVIDPKSHRTIPISDGAESYFVTHILAAKIASCHIGRDDNLVPHIAALREAYRRGFNG